MAPSPMRPPRLPEPLARLLLAGDEGALVRRDLEESFGRDLERGIPVGVALGGVWGWVLTLAVAGLVGALGCASPTIRGLRIQPSQALRES